MVIPRRIPLWALVIYALGTLAAGYATVMLAVAAVWIVGGDTVGVYVESSWISLLWFAVVALAIGTYVVRRSRGRP